MFDYVNYAKFKVYIKEVERNKDYISKSSSRQAIISKVSASQIMEGLASKRVDRKALRAELKALMIKEDTLPEDLDTDMVYKLYPRLIFSTIDASSMSHVSFLNDLLSPLSEANMGVSHTAVCFNNCLIEWNNSHMVVIRETKGSKAFLSATIKYKGKSYLEIPVLAFEEFLDKIIDVIIAWNVGYTYNETANIHKTKGQGNCQTFSLALLKALNIPYSFSPKISTLRNLHFTILSRIYYKF